MKDVFLFAHGITPNKTTQRTLKTEIYLHNIIAVNASHECFLHCHPTHQKKIRTRARRTY
jgi:hypothetical protein